MTISGALYNALSSMAAEQAQAQLIANNVANANTPGYVRRLLPVSENSIGGQGQGVALGVTQRAGDALLEAGLRSASADQAYGERMAGSLGLLTQAIGDPADGLSLSAQLGDFRSAMAALSATPGDSVAQSQAISAAGVLTDGLNAMDRAVTTARGNADRAVATDVEAINASLAALQKVEAGLARAAARGESTAEFEDQRAGLLGEIASRVPLRILGGAPGGLIVKTDQGTPLFDSGNVHSLSFTASSGIGSSNTLASQVTVDGQPLRSSASGSVAAALKLRDETLPAYGRMLDGIAGTLAGAFQQADPTATGTPRLAGLFSRGSAATLDAADTAGLAGSIAVNPKVLAESWRIRDGANAAAPGNAAENGTILAALDAMDAKSAYAAGGLNGRFSLADAASQAVGLMRSDSADWSSRAATRGAAATAAQAQLANRTGVNVDEEMQRLLMVQSSYAASAQVIQAAARMLDTLNSLNA